MSLSFTTTSNKSSRQPQEPNDHPDWPGPDALKLKQNKGQEKDGFPYSTLAPKRNQEYLDAPVPGGYCPVPGEVVHYLLNDFSKFIKASGHKHSCLLQGLVLGYGGFRSLVGTSSSMTKLDLGSREQQL